MRRRPAIVSAVAVALAALACLSMWSTWQDPVHWTLDSLFYQERVLEFRGDTHSEAHRDTFDGAIAADLRAEDPAHSGNAAWIAYNEPFYERRATVPGAAALLYPLTGQRSLLYVSLAGYVATIVALFGLLLTRFRLAVAGVVAGLAILLPPLSTHSSYPITDSWGLALQITALTVGIGALRGRLWWLAPWIAVIAVLGFTRDNVWIPVAAFGWLALRHRSRRAALLVATGVAAALPALLIFTTPVSNLLAMLVNDFQPSGDTSWSFIVRHYPSAVADLIRANVGYLRRGEWFTLLYLVGGVVALLVLAWKRRPVARETELMVAASVATLAYVLAAPAYSAFRLELAFLPMAAYGVAQIVEQCASRFAALDGSRLDRLRATLPRSSPPG